MRSFNLFCLKYKIGTPLIFISFYIRHKIKVLNNAKKASRFCINIWWINTLEKYAIHAWCIRRFQMRMFSQHFSMFVSWHGSVHTSLYIYFPRFHYFPHAILYIHYEMVSILFISCCCHCICCRDFVPKLTPFSWKRHFFKSLVYVY